MTQKQKKPDALAEQKADLLGVDETMDIVHATFEFTRKLVQQAADGLQLGPDLIATLFDRDVQAAIADAINNANLAGAEIKELSFDDIQALIIGVLEEVRELLAVINAQVSLNAYNAQLVEGWKKAGMRIQEPEKK